MRALFLVIDLALDIYIWLLIAAAILSWLVAFNVVNTRNQVVGMIGDFLYRITEPALRPIRNLMPDLGGIDISPVILILVIIFIRYVIALYISPERLLSRDPSRPWTVTSDGVVLTVRLTPKGGRDAIEGIETNGGRARVLKARVRAAASDGEANAALISLIARTLAVPPRVSADRRCDRADQAAQVMGDAGASRPLGEGSVGVRK